MTVTYEPPLTRSGWARPGDSLLREWITEGPAYARGPRSTRWHRIRSAERSLREHWKTGEPIIQESWLLWCGPYMFVRENDQSPILFADAPFEGEPSCGTCEGRAIGADSSRPEWLFQPSRLEPPKRCPGSGREMVREDQGRWNRATCLVCGDVVKLRALGSRWCPTWGAVAHEPGPDLVSGCEWHGWRELVVAATDAGAQVVTCRCRTVDRRSA